MGVGVPRERTCEPKTKGLGLRYPRRVRVTEGTDTELKGRHLTVLTRWDHQKFDEVVVLVSGK